MCPPEQPFVHAREVRHVSDEHHVSRLARQMVLDELRGIARLKPMRGAELRQGIAGAQERLGGLTRAKLTAVPDCLRLYAFRRRVCCKPFSMHTT